MKSMRARFLALIATLILGITIMMYWLFSNQTSILQDYIAYDNLGIASRMVSEIWDSQGGCIAQSNPVEFENFDLFFRDEIGITFAVECDGKITASSQAFPGIKIPAGGFHQLEDLEGMGWAISSHEIENGRVHVAGLDTDYWETTLIQSTEILLITVFSVFCGLLLAFWGVLKLIQPIEQLSDSANLSEQELGKIDIPFELMPLKASLLGMKETLKNKTQENQRDIDTERKFTANAAHELLTSLAAIKTELQLQQKMAGPKAATGTGRLLVRVDRAIYTVDQLIVLARLETGVSPESVTTVNFKTNAEEIFEDFNDKFKGKGLKISNLADDVNMMGSAHMLNILLRNLIHNAIIYSPDGGKITLSSIEEKPGFQNFTITNDSSEMPSYLVDHLFERFVRGPHETVTGSGLGLAIVKSIVEAHKGTITVNMDKSGREISFSLNLPNSFSSNSISTGMS